MRKEGKRKALAALVCGSMLTVALVGGTLAYLTDTDSDVNVMTLGNVSIEQHEYQRAVNEDGTYKTDTIDNRESYVLEDFTQDKALLPIVGDPNEPGDSDAYAGWDPIPVRMSQVDSYGGMKVFAGKNAQDKFVTVENTGKTDAYVRTIIAIEIGSTDGELIGQSYQDGAWKRTSVGKVVIDGNTYRVFEYNYPGADLGDGTYRHENGVLPAGDTTYPNFAQVYLKHNATNEDMAAIDGNFNGRLDILVLSQAGQTAGFDGAEEALDTMFGDVNVENVQKWFAGQGNPGAAYAEVANMGEAKDAIKDAVANGEDLVIVNAGDANIGSLNYGLNTSLVPANTTVVLKNANVEGKSYGNAVDGTVVFDNCTFTNTGAYSIHFDAGSGNVVFNNCVLEGWCSFGAAIKSVEMNNCTIKGNGTYAMVRFYQDAIMTNCTIDCSDAVHGDDYPDGLSAVSGAVLTLKDCTIAYCDFEAATGGKIVSDGIVVA